MEGKNAENFQLFYIFSSVCDLFLINKVFALLATKFSIEKTLKKRKVSHTFHFNLYIVCKLKSLTPDFSCYR